MGVCVPGGDDGGGTVTAPEGEQLLLDATAAALREEIAAHFSLPPEDIGVTASLAKAGEIIGIRLLDHVIVAGRLDDESPPYFSFRENGMLGRPAER